MNQTSWLMSLQAILHISPFLATSMDNHLYFAIGNTQTLLDLEGRWHFVFMTW